MFVNQQYERLISVCFLISVTYRILDLTLNAATNTGLRNK